MSDFIPPTKDKNGYVVEFIKALPVGWQVFYHLTGLLPFSIVGRLRYPKRAILEIRRGLHVRLRRRLGK